jgi:transcription initiation factor TFIID subunit 6
MQDAAKATLVDLVEMQMTELIREACIVQRHTKRSRPASFGIGNNNGVPIHRRLLDAADVNLALQWRGCDKIFLNGIGAQHTSAEKNKDDIVVLNNYLHSEPIVTPPSECGLTLHWLAIDGVQPNIAANPVAHPNRPTAEWPAVSPLVISGVSKTASVPSSVKLAHKLLPHVLSEELRLYFIRVTTALEANKEECSTALASRALRKQTSVMLHNIGLDSGVQELVPFLVQFAEYQIYDSFSQGSATVNTPRYCRLLVRLVERMLSNKHMHLELHLHQLIPPLLTCVVAHSVGTSISDHHDNEHSWLLREEAAYTLVHAVDIYGDQYATLKARILKTLCEASVSDKLSTQYGGIVGLSLFGPKAVEAFLLPLSVWYWSSWEKQLQDKLSSCNGMSHMLEISHCQQALLNALGSFLSNAELGLNMSCLMEDEFADAFGEKLFSLAVHSSEYSYYFL